MRKIYWYLSAYLRKHGVLLIAAVIGGVILFSLALPFMVNIFELKPKRYIGIVGDYALTDLPRPIQELLSQGLTSIQPDGSVQPALAERWVIEDDNKTYRFVIRRNIFWPDGKPFVPSDVNYNFKDVQTITTANDVVFKLPTPFVPFPTVTSQPLFRLINKRWWFLWQKTQLLGLGQYQVTDYHEKGPRLVDLSIESKNERRVYRFYLSEDDAIAAFQRGEIDELPDLSDAGTLKNWSTISVKKILDYQTYLGVFFNLDDPLFQDSKELRQALNYALPKPDDDTHVYGPISPQSWAFADIGKAYEEDLGRATERLLATKDRANIPLTFDLTTTNSFADVADDIKQRWEHLGDLAADACRQGKGKEEEKKNCENLRIRVNIKINNFPDLNDYTVLLIGQTIPTDPDQYSLWHADQRTNFTHYKNTRIDSLLEKGRQTTDQEKRKEIYHDFQQFFSEDGPVIFLKYLYKFEVKRK